MDLVSVIVVLVIIGVALYLINTLIPLDGKIKTIINVVIVVVICLWLLSMFTGNMHTIRIGR